LRDRPFQLAIESSVAIQQERSVDFNEGFDELQENDSTMESDHWGYLAHSYGFFAESEWSSA
jgi:hypothetical protein